MTIQILSLLLLLQQAPPPLPINSQANFSHSGLDEKGVTESLSECEIALTSVIVSDLNVGGTVVKSIRAPAKSGSNTVALATLFQGQPNGQVKVWTRVFDLAGNSSKWGSSSTITLDGTAPAAPIGLSISITVTATVTVPSGGGAP